MKNPYKVLGVSSLDSLDVVKTQYRKLCKYYHPDNPKTGDRNKFEEIKEAYEVITTLSPKTNSSSSNKRMIWGHKTVFTIKRRAI